MIWGEIFEDNGDHISHLQFVDDTILFLKPRVDFLLNLKRIFRCFELASGLRINFHKLCLVRIGKGKARETTQWASMLRCNKATLPISYLGFPLGARSCSKSFWDLIIRNIENFLALQKKKFLSKSARLVLIKAVISSIPNYFLSVFKISVNVAQKIEKLKMNFLWGNGVEKRKWHAVKWEEVCKSRVNGGLGVVWIIDKKKKKMLCLQSGFGGLVEKSVLLGKKSFVLNIRFISRLWIGEGITLSLTLLLLKGWEAFILKTITRPPCQVIT